MNLRDYTFLGTTRSLCPHCRRLVDAKIIVRDGRVYFRKRCPEHGLVEDFVCSDVAYYDRHEFSQPARLPRAFGARSDKGCPYDCGLCPEHEQHTCIALIEITSDCNLKCPMCFAESGPGGKHIDFETYRRMVDRYVEPRRRRRRAAAVRRRADAAPRTGAHGPLRLRAADPGGDDQHQRHPPGPRPGPGRSSWRRCATGWKSTSSSTAWRTPPTPPCAARRCWKPSWPPWRCCDGTTSAARWSARWTTTPTCTKSAACLRSAWNGRSCAASASSWRPTAAGTSNPADLEKRATMPDVVKAIVAQTDGLVAESDFYPLPCAHPNCHMMCYLYRGGAAPVPINRLIDVRKHMDLIANSIVYTPARARQLVVALSRRGRRLRLRPQRLRPCALPESVRPRGAARRVHGQGAGREAQRHRTSFASR